MRKLLNTFYVTIPDAYLALDGENIVVRQQETELRRVPLHNLDGIVTYGRQGASPALMRKCAEAGISLSFMTEYGRFMAGVVGEERGNVLLRRTQYRYADNEIKCVAIAQNILTGKLHNSRWVLERTVRDHALRVDSEKIKRAAGFVYDAIDLVRKAKTPGELFGIEGEAATQYFSVFDEMILSNKEDFFFHKRSRRPPLDNVNTLLSFVYTLLTNDISSALSAVGLDPFVGFLHRDRPGRRSLALDLLEELRAPLADRFVLKLINMRQLVKSDFMQKESGAVVLHDDARRNLLTAWQNRKQEQLEHPYLKEKIQWGLVPYTQALLMARYLRGDLDEYPPFLWK
ncbi:MAG: type I-C CRISPR-associated endonuclease Cas1c [Defluviitaleaceae bacterium]|nr:type I-C CRISPR-associated endonuclease Cas1c [Defluviitaleaceae bacterium]